MGDGLEGKLAEIRVMETHSLVEGCSFLIDEKFGSFQAGISQVVAAKQAGVVGGPANKANAAELASTAILENVGAVQVLERRRVVADLANRLICGR